MTNKNKTQHYANHNYDLSMIPMGYIRSFYPGDGAKDKSVGFSPNKSKPGVILNSYYNGSEFFIPRGLVLWYIENLINAATHQGLINSGDAEEILVVLRTPDLELEEENTSLFEQTVSEADMAEADEEEGECVR